MSVITRFAPSPTGFVHIGSLRTVLYNYLFAKKMGGKFMLRIEDTDQTRYVEGSIENLLRVLHAFGLDPDEGPNNPGKVGPYYQSERLDIYKKYVDELIKNDKAYYCFCSSERLDELRKEQQELGLPTKYDGHCKGLSTEEIQEKLNSGTPYTIRLKVPKGKKIFFDDIIKGRVEVDSKDVDDQVLLKSDGFPTYHLANVVDDHLMGVTHVIRGDEWTPSTPKHILMYEAFGWTPPTFAHIPLLLGMDKKKLSKRTGDVSCESYLEKGYIIEAIINYIALLGWNPKSTEEFFTMDELIEKFDLEAVHKAGAVFDIEKLEWFSAKYLTKLNIETLYNLLKKYLEKYDSEYAYTLSKFDDNYNKKIIKELQTRLKRLGEYRELTKFFYNDVGHISQDLLVNEKMKIENIDIAKKGLYLALEILSANNDFQSVDEVKNVFVEGIQKAEMKNGQVLWPVRIALSGEKESPGALELIFILGNKKSSERINNLLKNLN
nr:glutamate--tRNA ligase [Candidatus Gracilibacteria bacterium]